MTQGDGGESKAGLGRTWASKPNLPARAEEFDGGDRQHSARLRYHTMIRGKTNQLLTRLGNSFGVGSIWLVIF
jgi:hypothetical protein